MLSPKTAFFCFRPTSLTAHPPLMPVYHVGSGCSGFSDDEIYSMAVHYYDEDNIEVGKPNSCKVVVNHTIELTEEEKAEARQRP